MKETREIVRNSPVERVELERPFEPQIQTNNGHYPMYRSGSVTENSQLLEYWRAVRKRLWLVIGITVLITTLTAIYMARRPSIYQAKAVVQVDTEQPNQDLVVAERKLPSSNSDPAYFNTQLQLLTSESLLRRVVKDFSLDSSKEFQKLKKDDSVSVWRSFLTSIGLVSEVKKSESKGIEEVTPTTGIASADEVNQAVRLAPYVDILKKNLTIEPVREGRGTFKETRLIEIYYKNTDPELATAIVNGIALTFTKQNQEKRTGNSKETNEFLDERIANLQSEIRVAQNKYVEMTRDKGILKTDDQQTIVLARLQGLNKQLLDAEEERKNTESAFKAINDSPERLKSLVEISMTRYITEQENSIRSLINETQEKVAGLKAEKERRLVEYRDGATEVQEIQRQIDTLEGEVDKAREKNQKNLEEFRVRSANDIKNDLQTKYLTAKNTEEKMRADYNQQYNQAQVENQSAVQLGLLKQDIDTKQDFLKKIQGTQSGNEITDKGTDNNIHVVEIGIPPETPIAPSRTVSVILAMLLSTLFGIGLALFLEYLDDTIRTTEDVENYLGLPALAAIPTIDSLPKKRLLLVGGKDDEKSVPETELLITADSRSSLAEAYRQLRTSILLSTAGHAPKSLLITSSLPAEGKTTTAVNTAISLAQTGAKVLIIDADMRRPRLHKIFNIGNGEGLSSILSSDLSENEILDIIQTDPATKLNLMPSGPVPPNPAELIGSEQMTKLLKVLENEFTHVVVDSPPIASFTDGVLIASMVDGVILVVHSGKSSRQVIRRSIQLLNDIGAKVFGTVLNNVNLRSQDNYYYYQSYYHRDNYRQDSEE